MGEVFGEVTIDKKADTNSLTVSKISVSQALPGKKCETMCTYIVPCSFWGV